MASWYDPNGDFPILSLITYLPVIGALFITFFLRKNQDKAVKVAANVVFLLGFLLSLPLLANFDSTLPQDYQFQEQFTWFETGGGAVKIGYHFGMDGISLWLFMLTSLLGAVACLASWTGITERLKEFYVFLLLLQTGMLGVFVALDFVLFYVFWEVMLVPMYFLIGIWGGENRLYAAIKFFLFTLLGSVLMLLGILTIFFQHEMDRGFYTFDIPMLTQYLSEIPLPTADGWLFGMQGAVFLAFFIGFAIKVPMFPFHTWLPDAHVQAPTAGSVILAGVLLKMGTYGFVRFCMPMFPDAMDHFMGLLVTLAIIGIVYGALVAMKQDDVKKLIAYSSVSHMGFLMLGLFALNQNGLLGGMLQMINHGLSTGALFLIVGIIYERRHTKLIREFGGLSKVMPIYAVVFLIATMSSIGLPVLNGFIGEFTVLVGVFEASHVWAAFAASGIVLGAAYMLWLYQRMMFGKVTNPANEKLLDLSRREILVFAPIIVLCFWIGIYPKPFIERMEPSIARTISLANKGAPTAGKPSIRGRIKTAQAEFEAKRQERMKHDHDDGGHDDGGHDDGGHGSAEESGH